MKIWDIRTCNWVLNMLKSLFITYIISILLDAEIVSCVRPIYWFIICAGLIKVTISAYKPCGCFGVGWMKACMWGARMWLLHLWPQDSAKVHSARKRTSFLSLHACFHLLLWASLICVLLFKKSCCGHVLCLWYWYICVQVWQSDLWLFHIKNLNSA